MQRRDVVSTLMRRCIDVMCLLGNGKAMDMLILSVQIGTSDTDPVSAALVMWSPALLNILATNWI